MFEFSNGLVEEPSPSGYRLTSKETTLAFPGGGFTYRRPGFVESEVTGRREPIVDYTFYTRLAVATLTLAGLAQVRRKK